MNVSTWRHYAKLGVAWGSAPGILGAMVVQGSTGTNRRQVPHHGVFATLLYGPVFIQNASIKLRLLEGERLAMRLGADIRLC